MADDTVLAKLEEMDQNLSVIWRRDVWTLKRAAWLNVVLLALILWRVW